MDFRFERILRPIAAITLFFFSWISIEPWNYAVWAQTAPQKADRPVVTASAKSKSSSGKFEESLRAAKKVVEELDQDVASSQDITLQLESLKGHKQTLEAVDPEIRAEFAATEKFLKEKKLPAEILARHAKAVADYDTNYKTLKANLDSIVQLETDRKKAEGQNDRTLAQSKRNELKATIKTAKDHLTAKVKEPRHQKLDPNNLPHRTAKPTNKKPRLKKEEFKNMVGANSHSPILLAYNGDPTDLLVAQNTQDLPTPADLAETIEVQFTPDIQAKAAELEHNPVKIYNWVHNNIDFVPTYGSIQGANHCLLTKQCNDMDTASLLIALLRTSGIAARYVTGTIQVPMDQVMNWVGGFTDTTAALGFIASGGTPVQAVTSGGKFIAAQMEHTWVEAYVDYIPSRGAVHKQGDTWVPMDGSFKQFNFTDGLDLQAVTELDGQTLMNQVLSAATINEQQSYTTNMNAAPIETTARTATQNLKDYVAQNLPNSTLGNVIGSKTIVIKEYPFLVGTLPYKPVAVGTKMSQIPDSLQYKIMFEVTTDPFSGPDLSYSVSLPALAGGKITLNYVPATQADQDVLTALFPQPHPDGSPILPEELPGSLPAYLLNIKPELRLDNQVVAVGGSIRMGSDQEFSIRFIDPSGFGNEAIKNTVMAGEIYAIALDSGAIPKQHMESQKTNLQAANTKLQTGNLSSDERIGLIGDLLYSVILTYFYELEALDALTAKAMRVVHLRLPSEGVFFSRLDADYLFGVPKSVRPAGMMMDVDGIFYTVAARDGDRTLGWKFGLTSGPMSSALEHSVPEQILSSSINPVHGISAVKALSLANGQGIPIYTINKDNAGFTIPQLAIDTAAIADIQNAVNAGKLVSVSKTPVLFDGSSVLGYMIIDPANGSGAYIVSGASGSLVGILNEVLQKVVWGTFAFASIAAGLTGAPLLAGLLIAVMGAVTLGVMKWALEGDVDANIATTLVGFIATYVLANQLNFYLGFASLGLATPVSAVALPLLAILAMSMLTLIMIDYMFTFALTISPQRRSYAWIEKSTRPTLG